MAHNERLLSSRPRGAPALIRPWSAHMCSARRTAGFRPLEPKDSMRQPGDMSRVIIEGDGVDDVAGHGEPIAVELAVALCAQLFSKFVPPCLPVGQGATGDHDGAGGLPHGRMLLRDWAVQPAASSDIIDSAAIWLRGRFQVRPMR